MDPQLRVALTQAAQNPALTPAQRQQIMAWIAGGQPPVDPTVVQGVNSVLRQYGQPPLGTTGAPQQGPPTPPMQGPPAPPTLPQPPSTATPAQAVSQQTPVAGKVFGNAFGNAVQAGRSAATAPPQATTPSIGASPLNLGGQPGMASGAPPTMPPASPLNMLAQPGQASGAPPPAPPVAPVPNLPVTGGGGNTVVAPATGPGSKSFMQEETLRNNPDIMLQQLLGKIGISLEDPGLFGKQIASGINDYLPAAHALAGLGGSGFGGGDVNNMFGGLLNELAGSIGNNTFYSGLRDKAQGARGTVTGLAGRLQSDPTQQRSILDQLLALETAGGNDYLRQADADSSRNAWLRYQDENFDTLGDAGPKDYVSFLQRQTDPRYQAVLRLFGR
jgi:hypothetical protein